MWKSGTQNLSQYFLRDFGSGGADVRQPIDLSNALPPRFLRVQSTREAPMHHL